MAKANLDLGKPEKFSFIYWFLRNCWFLLWFRLWYKNITIVGKENISKSVPTILAINHQNTAMDPLVLCGTLTRQISWLARADLYKKKAFIPFLHLFKILPVFRQRDGIKSLENNDAVFEKVVDIIFAKKLVGLFPEGTHWGFHRLRQTRKAIPRVVCMAAEKHHFDVDININPVGIYYEDYTAIRKNLFIKIGDAIPMRQYMKTLQENPQVAENEIRTQIEKGLRSCMIDIPQTDETYHTVEKLREICRPVMSKHLNLKGNRQEREFQTDKYTIDIIENKEQESIGFIRSLQPIVWKCEGLRKLKKYSYDLIEKNGGDAFQIMWDCMKMIVFLPFFLCACVFNGINFLVMQYAAKKLVKDELFKNSILFVVGILMITITHPVFAILWLVFVPLPWWTIFVFLLFLFFLWTIFIDYPRLVKRVIDSCRFNVELLRKDASLLVLCESYQQIQKTMKELIDKR